MGNFQGGGGRGGGYRGGNSGGRRPNFQKKSWPARAGGGGDRGGDREAVMHKAVCDECSKPCEVPFRPSEDKPVYCSNCFSNKRESGDRAPRADFNDRGPKRDFNDRPAPRTDFTRPSSAPTQAPAFDDTKKQLREINMKIDRLMIAMEKLSHPVQIVKTTEVKERPSLTEVLKKAVEKPVVKKVATKKVISKKK